MKETYPLWVVQTRKSADGPWVTEFMNCARSRRMATTYHNLGTDFEGEYGRLSRRGLARVVRCRIEVEEPEVKG